MAVENLTSINDVPNGLAELEEDLRTLSHDTQAIEIIKRFAKSLRKTSERFRVLGQKLEADVVRLKEPLALRNEAKKCDLEIRE